MPNDLSIKHYSISEVEDIVGGGWGNGSVFESLPKDSVASLEDISIYNVAYYATPLDSYMFTDNDEGEYVHAIGQSLQAGEGVPPIVVHRTPSKKYHVEDGWHRVSAAAHYKISSIKAFIFDITYEYELEYADA